MRVQRGSSLPKSLKDRLAEFAAGVRKATDELPPNAGGDESLRKSRLLDIAAHIDGWANSSGLQTPK
jgi:hypothetical protein